jgi:hypothetical protein
VIDVEVGEQDCVKLRHMRPGLPEAQRAATAAIDKDARLAVVPHEIAAGRSLIFELRAA